MDNTNMPYLNGTKPVPMPAEQVFFANVANQPAMGAVPQMNHDMFFDNNPQQAGEDGTLDNTFAAGLFSATTGFTDTGVTYTTNPAPIGMATNPMGNTGQLAQGQSVPSTSQPVYNPTKLG